MASSPALCSCLCCTYPVSVLCSELCDIQLTKLSTGGVHVFCVINPRLSGVVEARERVGAATFPVQLADDIVGRPQVR